MYAEDDKAEKQRAMETRKLKSKRGKFATFFGFVIVLIAVLGYGFWGVDVWRADDESNTEQFLVVQGNINRNDIQSVMTNNQSRRDNSESTRKDENSQNIGNAQKQNTEETQSAENRQLQFHSQEKHGDANATKEMRISDNQLQEGKNFQTQINLRNPIAYVSEKEANQFVFPLNLSLDLRAVQPFRQQDLSDNDLRAITPSENKRPKTSLLDYIEVERCRENEKAPDYLDHKLTGETQREKEGVSDMLRLPSCGMIRTKIPLSF